MPPDQADQDKTEQNTQTYMTRQKIRRRDKRRRRRTTRPDPPPRNGPHGTGVKPNERRRDETRRDETRLPQYAIYKETRTRNRGNPQWDTTTRYKRLYDVRLDESRQYDARLCIK